MSPPDELLPPYGRGVDLALWDSESRLKSSWAAIKGLLGGDSAVEGVVRLVRSISGAKHAVAFSSGGSALTCGLEALALPRGGEVIMPSYLCSRVAVAVVSAGLRPCLVDVGPDCLVLTEAVKEAINPKTCAIVAAHLYGCLCAMATLSEIATENDLVLVDDAAQALGARCDGKPAGTLGDFGILSFGPGKIGYGIGGGCLLTDREELIQAMPERLPCPRRAKEFQEGLHYMIERRLRKTLAPYRFWKRRNSPKTYREASLEAPPPRIAAEGMGSLQARVCLASLLELDIEVAARSMIAQEFEERLQGVEGLILPAQQEGRVFSAYPVWFGGRHRYEICSQLAASGIETVPPYYPLHMQRALAPVVRIGSTMDRTEEAFRHLVILPVHRGVGDRQIASAASFLEKIARTHHVRTGGTTSEG